MRVHSLEIVQVKIKASGADLSACRRPGSGMTILLAKEKPSPVSRVLFLVEVSPQSVRHCACWSSSTTPTWIAGRALDPVIFRARMDERLMANCLGLVLILCRGMPLAAVISAVAVKRWQARGGSRRSR